MPQNPTLVQGTLITTSAGMAVQQLHLGRVRHQHVPDELSGDQEAVQVLAARRGGGKVVQHSAKR